MQIGQSTFDFMSRLDHANFSAHFSLSAYLLAHLLGGADNKNDRRGRDSSECTQGGDDGRRDTVLREEGQHFGHAGHEHGFKIIPVFIQDIFVGGQDIVGHHPK